MKREPLEVRSRQAGSVTIEFSLVAIIFFTVVLATLELARFEFLLNTLQEVTRRAAAAASNTDFRNSAALQAVQANAVFRNSRGPLGLGDPVTSDNVAIDYMSLSRTTWDLKPMSTLPSSPARNQLNCITDPNADNCIRFVRVRICASTDGAGGCTPVSYQRIFPFLDLSMIKLPPAETVVAAGSLGFTSGSMP
jgi:hypothetical protein